LKKDPPKRSPADIEKLYQQVHGIKFFEQYHEKDGK
jgi:hypothetical protein